MRTNKVVVILLIFILFTSIILTTTNKVYGIDDERRHFPSEYDGYQHVICSNGVWYPEGTDCNVALIGYYEEWHNIGEEVKEDNDKKLREAYHKEHHLLLENKQIHNVVILLLKTIKQIKKNVIYCIKM